MAKKKGSISNLIKEDMSGRFIPREDAPEEAGTKPAPPGGRETGEAPGGAGAEFTRRLSGDVERNSLFDEADKERFYAYMLTELRRYVRGLELEKQNGKRGVIIMTRKNQWPAD